MMMDEEEFDDVDGVDADDMNVEGIECEEMGAGEAGDSYAYDPM